MRKIVQSTLLIFGSVLFYSQTNVKPPNLDAISVFNFTETPVSLNTGMVDISYPVYEIKTKGLTIPIKLDYFSRGVKVEDIASSVGLGWSLNYGGMISRQIREQADEASYGYLFNNIYTDFFTNNSKRLSVLGQMNTSVGVSEIDFTPDQFYFSLADSSGKFILDAKDKNAIQQSFSDAKIEFFVDQGVIASWTIIDSKGNKYYYGKSSSNNKNYISKTTKQSFIQPNSLFIDYQTGGTSESFPDTWYLNKIVTQYGEIIQYNYTTEELSYFRKDYDKQISPCLAPCDNPPGAGTLQTFFSKINETKPILESIEFPNGRLKFTPSTTPRQDVIGLAYPLEKIDIVDKNNHIIESHRITYDYVTAVSDNSNTSPLLSSLDTSSNKRMYLKSITRENKNIPISKYQYNYNSTNMPNRFSTSQDLWGYYNGANNGTFNHFYAVNGLMENRDTDETLSKAGILENIVSSTGSTTKFIYENNILMAPYFNFNKLLGKLNGNFDEKRYLMTKPVSPGGDGNDYNQSLNYNSNEGVFYQDFTIDNLYNGGEINFDFDYQRLVNPNFPKICIDYVAQIEKDGSPVILFPTRPSTTNTNIFKGISGTQMLTSGTYRIKIRPRGCFIDNTLTNPTESIYLNITWKSSKRENSYAGPGQRIKAIEYYDGNEIKLKKTYEYTDENNDNSGNLFGMKEYAAIIGYKSFYGGPMLPVIDPMGVKSGDYNSFLESNNFGYSYIKEYIGDKTNNKGRIDYQFTQYPDTWKFAEYPFHWANDNQWIRGLLLEQKFFEKQNDSFRLIKKIKNRYRFGALEYDNLGPLVGPFPGLSFATPPLFEYQKNKSYYKIPLAKIYFNTAMELGIATPDLDSPYLIHSGGGHYSYYKPFYFTGGKIEKYSTDITEYYPHAEVLTQNIFETSSEYNTITKQTSILPDGIIKTSEFAYAPDINNLKMKSENMVSIPLIITEKQTIGGISKMTAKTEINYPDQTNFPSIQAGNILVPLSQFSYDVQKEIAFPKADITYDKYDSYGNLQQYTTKEGVPTTVIWGYGSSSPIAKIEGIKLSDIPQGIIDPIINASNDDASYGTTDSENFLLDALKLFTSNPILSNYKVTTYTYDPLIGVTSITPPSGIKEVYEYDTAHRLIRIVDADKKIMALLNILWSEV
ncbi:RHS repeat domain-containing protein [Chryseobacterium indologenes]|uniref:RHS repeat domain-containing protein n=1 Tax=Chryseobacterium indologenes TaxID=253 RepID=UPI00162995BA|nr:RHS repeat domain-containing protein [Chryseobacterium indologenes]